MNEANLELDVPCRNKEIGMEMMKLLPPLSQACQMCETFLEYGKYVYVLNNFCVAPDLPSLTSVQMVPSPSTVRLRRHYLCRLFSPGEVYGMQHRYNTFARVDVDDLCARNTLRRQYPAICC